MNNILISGHQSKSLLESLRKVSEKTKRSFKVSKNVRFIPQASLYESIIDEACAVGKKSDNLIFYSPHTLRLCAADLKKIKASGFSDSIVIFEDPVLKSFTKLFDYSKSLDLKDESTKAIELILKNPITFFFYDNIFKEWKRSFKKNSRVVSLSTIGLCRKTLINRLTKFITEDIYFDKVKCIGKIENHTLEEFLKNENSQNEYLSFIRENKELQILMWNVLHEELETFSKRGNGAALYLNNLKKFCKIDNNEQS